MDNSELSLGYMEALRESNYAAAEFHKAQQAYRNRLISDAEFLVARKQYDAANASFDIAYYQEQCRYTESN